MVFFVVQKLFDVMGSFLLIVDHYTFAADVDQKLHSYPNEFSLFPTFYSEYLVLRWGPLSNLN